MSDESRLCSVNGFGMGERHPNLLLEKSEAFALRIVRLYRYLDTKKHERILSKQILRSGTSIGANIAEGHYAASKADFINKYVIAEKEAAETAYWIRLLIKSDYLENDSTTESLVRECDELIRLLAASVKTARGKG